MTKRLLLGVCFSLLFGEVRAQASDYSKLRISRIIASSPKLDTCYDSRIGHYSCLAIPVNILHIGRDGKEWSVSVRHKLDGAYVATVVQEFGTNSRLYFAAVQNALPLGQLKMPANLNLSPEIQQLANDLVASINEFESSLDLSENTNSIYYFQATRAAWDLAEGMIRSEASLDIKKAQLLRTANATKALIAYATKGFDVGSSLLPFVGDARDLYELVNGVDLLSGEPLSTFERFLSAAAIVGGNGPTFRKIADKLGNSITGKVVESASKGIPNLTYTGNGSWKSEAGLIYRPPSGQYENTLRHVLKHAKPDPSKPQHSVFKVTEPKEIPKLIDEAWRKRGQPVGSGSLRGTYIVEMGRTIGTQSETKLKVVVSADTTELISAYPIK